MVLASIAQVANDEGLASCTYDRLALATGLSRAKISNGLAVLTDLGVIERKPAGRSSIQLTDFSNGHPAAIAARPPPLRDRHPRDARSPRPRTCSGTFRG